MTSQQGLTYVKVLYIAGESRDALSGIKFERSSITIQEEGENHMPFDPASERDIRSAYGPGTHEAIPKVKMVVVVKALVHD